MNRRLALLASLTFLSAACGGAEMEEGALRDLDANRLTALPKAQILLGQAAYFAPPLTDPAEWVTITVADSNVGAAQVTVTVGIQDSPVAPESVTLNENPAGSGIYAGAIRIVGSFEIAGNGRLEAADGNTIVATYVDSDIDGYGHAAPFTATAAVDYSLGPNLIVAIDEGATQATPPVSGEPYEVHFTVTNIGGSAAVASVTLVRIMDRSRILYKTVEVPTPALGAGDSVPLTGTIDVPPSWGGATQLLTYCNYRGSVRETDRSDNTDYLEVEIVGADLIVEIDEATTGEPTVGELFQVNFTVTNKGGGTSGETKTQIRLMHNARILYAADHPETPGLAPGASVPLTGFVLVPASWEPWAGTLQAYVDEGQVDETNNPDDPNPPSDPLAAELNNTDVLDVTISAP